MCSHSHILDLIYLPCVIVISLHLCLTNAFYIPQLTNGSRKPHHKRINELSNYSKEFVAAIAATCNLTLLQIESVSFILLSNVCYLEGILTYCD